MEGLFLREAFSADDVNFEEVDWNSNFSLEIEQISTSAVNIDDKRTGISVRQGYRSLLSIHGSDLGAVSVQDNGKGGVLSAIVGNGVVVRPIGELVGYHDDLFSCCFTSRVFSALDREISKGGATIGSRLSPLES